MKFFLQFVIFKIYRTLKSLKKKRYWNTFFKIFFLSKTAEIWISKHKLMPFTAYEALYFLRHHSIFNGLFTHWLLMQILSSKNSEK